MATRYYLPSTGAADVSPVFHANWEKTSEADRLEMVKTKISSAFITKVCTENVATDPYDVLNRQYVSDPIGVHDFTLCAYEIQIRCMEDAAKMDARFKAEVRVFSNDGNTERGGWVVGFGSVEFDDDELVNRRTYRSSPVTPFSSQNGDRIVIELGVLTTNTKTVLYTATMDFGDNSGTDLPEDESDTNQYNPWIEFTHDITPYDPGGVPPGWNRIEYTSEPPTPNAWNQVKREAGTGWKKLLYE